MARRLFRSRQAATLCIALCALSATADEPAAPFVPTVQDDVELMLEIGAVGPGDYVMDLGSGDGRIVITAAQRGAFGHGVEIDGELVEQAKQRAEAAGVADRVTFVQGDIFKADISQANVVTLYLFPEVNLALRPRLLTELRPGTRVLSNSFDMGNWKPDEHDMSARSSGGILLWIVPADVAGDWQIVLDGDDSVYALDVLQRFQEINLRLDDDGKRFAVRSADLRGDRISFAAFVDGRSYAFSGRVDGDEIKGIAQIHDEQGSRITKWQARRSGASVRSELLSQVEVDSDR